MTTIDPATAQLILTGLRLGRSAVDLLNQADLSELPEEQRNALLDERDRLNAEWASMLPGEGR